MNNPPCCSAHILLETKGKKPIFWFLIVWDLSFIFKNLFNNFLKITMNRFSLLKLFVPTKFHTFISWVLPCPLNCSSMILEFQLSQFYLWNLLLIRIDVWWVFFFQVFCVDEFLNISSHFVYESVLKPQIKFCVFTINSIKRDLGWSSVVTTGLWFHLVPSQYEECKGRKPVHDLLPKKFWKPEFFVECETWPELMPSFCT